MKRAIAFICATACVVAAVGATHARGGTRPSAEAGALAATSSFFAGVAHGRLRQTCRHLRPRAIAPLGEPAGCPRRLAALRVALMGVRGASGALSPAALISRMRTAASVRSVSAHGNHADVLVPPCLGLFTLTRTPGQAWRVARLPFS